jgi:hypothetical protein
MSLKARLAVVDEPARPAAFTCRDYEPLPGSKRCRSYLANGGCARDDHFMCEEWVKANGQAVQPPGEVPPEPARDLFGNALPDEPPPKKLATENASPPPSKAAPFSEQLAAERDAPLVRNLTDEDIASFKALGVEVCIASEEIGEVWIVPEYTGQERRELRIDHAATLTAVCATFPGAKVTSFEKLVKPGTAKPT